MLRFKHVGVLGLAVVLAGCSAGKDDNGGFSTGSDSGIGDGDGDGDGDDGGGFTPPPEEEDEGDFRVPRASGKYVYAASETTDRVAVIDTDSLSIDVVDVCRGPTVVEPLPGQDAGKGAVAVLCQGSDEVALIHTDAQGENAVQVRAVTPGANNLRSSLDGGLVFVYHDIDGPESLGPGSDQELTAVDTDPAGMTYEMTVGAHPRDVVLSTQNDKAFVVTADGVNVIELAALGMIGKPPLVPVVDDAAIDPDFIEVRVAVDHGIALARVDGEPFVAVTDLDTYEQTIVDVPDIPTDLDIAPDGKFAIVTVPQIGGSLVLDFNLPLTPIDPYDIVEIDTEYVGLSHLSDDGEAMILYTTVDPFSAGGDAEEWGERFALDMLMGTDTGGTDTGGTDTGGMDTDTGGDDGGVEPPDFDPRMRVTILRKQGGVWTDVDTLFVESPVKSVGIAPDSLNAMLLHTENAELDPVARWAYTLIDLSKQNPVKKLQKVQAEPKTVIFPPNGDLGAVLLRRDSDSIRRVDFVDLRTFIVDQLPLGSPPTGGGYVEPTNKIYVSQEHASGRITFIDAEAKVQTVTGYELNDAVKD